MKLNFHQRSLKFYSWIERENKDAEFFLLISTRNNLNGYVYGYYTDGILQRLQYTQMATDRSIFGKPHLMCKPHYDKIPTMQEYRRFLDGRNLDEGDFTMVSDLRSV